jgi:hypothetical protein
MYTQCREMYTASTGSYNCSGRPSLKEKLVWHYFTTYRISLPFSYDVEHIWSQSHITTDDQSISASWFWAPSGAHDQMLITVWQLLFCRYRAPSLTRGRVCHFSRSFSLCSLWTGRKENTASNNSSIAEHVSVARKRVYWAVT